MTQQESEMPDYIGIDLAGYYFNHKYPPNKAEYGTHYGGYKTDNQEAFFYDMSVYFYGLRFFYNGIYYRIPSDGDSWVLINEDNNSISEGFEDPIQLIENVTIEGKRIVDLIDEFKDVEIQ